MDQRRAILKDIHRRLLQASRNGYACIQELVISDINTLIESFPIPNSPIVQMYTKDRIDNNALMLYPWDGPDDFVPLKSTPDGNCLYNSISILLIGCEDMSLELRIRTVLSMINFIDFFYTIRLLRI